MWVNFKATYLIRILTMLAGVIFLAHTAIPHHHHDQQVCFGTDHCECSKNPHSDDHENHNHPFDASGPAHQCCVSEFIPVSSLDISRLSKSEDLNDKYSPDINYSILPEQIFHNARVRKSTACHNENEDPLGVDLYYSFGLRAPPQV